MKDLATATIDGVIRQRKDTTFTPSIIHKNMLKFIPEHRKMAQQVYASLFTTAEACTGSNAELGSYDKEDRISAGQELGRLRAKASQHFARRLERKEVFM